MSYAPSMKNIVKAVKSPAARMSRFMPGDRSARVAGGAPRQSVRTSTNPAKSIAPLKGGGVR